MDYEKKYKEALEWARKVMQGKVGFVLDDVLEKFPELKESEDEDERIRERLIQIFKSYQNPKTHINPNKWEGLKICNIIAWLEKQYADPIKEYWRGYNEGKQNVLDKYAELEKQGEQNLANSAKTCKDEQKPYNCVDYKDAIMHVVRHYVIPDEIDDELRRIAKGKWKYATWSEEDEVCLGDALWCCKQAASIAKDENDMGNVWYAEYWLKSLKERVQPQPKQEWSEEDESRITTICTYLQDYARLSGSESRTIRINEYCDWLKSLKERVLPQPKQEWSDVDKDILFRTINNLKFLRDTISIDPKYAINIIDIEREITWLKSLRPQNKYAYNPYKAVVESIAEMCKHYDKASHSGLRDFYDNVKVKCKDAKEYDSLYPQNTWKPSDGQLECLRYAINKAEKDWSPLTNNRIYLTLKALKEQLLELRGSKV